MIRNHPVFGRVLEAMQTAEELGGCEPEDYGALMAEIEREARTRRHVFARVLAGHAEPRLARAFVFRFPGPGALLVFAVVSAWFAMWGAVDIAVRALRFLGAMGG